MVGYNKSMRWNSKGISSQHISVLFSGFFTQGKQMSEGIQLMYEKVCVGVHT